MTARRCKFFRVTPPANGLAGRGLVALALLLAGLAATSPVSAQRAPYGAERYGTGNSRNGYGSNSTGGNNVAGRFDYYALVLSWSPTHCATSNRSGDELQCNPSNGRRYSFVLHGLWPQYEKRWPEDCRMNGSTFVPNPVINEMLEVMPAKGLIIHEYKKHGTCSGLAPAQYFHLARNLFHKIKVPARYLSPAEAQFVAPGELVAEFVKANPEFSPDMIAVACDSRNGNSLQEIHFCLNRSGSPRACGQNEAPKRLCRADKMFVPPVRASQSGANAGTSRSEDQPLPEPRLRPRAP